MINEKEVRRMKKTNDGIIFEDRQELGDVINILEEWMKDHPRDQKKATAQSLVKLVDAIEMSW